MTERHFHPVAHDDEGQDQGGNVFELAKEDTRSQISGSVSFCGQSNGGKSRLRQPTRFEKTKSPALNATLERIEREEADCKLFRTIGGEDEPGHKTSRHHGKVGHQHCLEKSRSSMTLAQQKTIQSRNTMLTSRTKTPN